MKVYRWNEQDGILDENNYQVLQLFSNSKKFRRMAGKNLVNLLNNIERGQEAAKERNDK